MTKISSVKKRRRTLTAMSSRHGGSDHAQARLLDNIIENINKLYDLVNGSGLVANLLAAMSKSSELRQLFNDNIEKYISTETFLSQLIEKISIKSTTVTVVTGVSIDEEASKLQAATKSIKVLSAGTSGTAEIAELGDCPEET